MKKIIITESQYSRLLDTKSLLMESDFLFPIGNDNFNVGYDEVGLGRGVTKVLDKNKAYHNSDYGGGDAKHRRSGGHKGIDIFAPKGTPLVACVNGIISRIGKGTPKGGNTVNIKAKDGKHYYYAHLDSIASNLNKGDHINKGTFIGTVGDSGNAKGTHPHLHFSVYKGTYGRGSIDPWQYLKGALDGEDMRIIEKDDVIDKVDGTVVTDTITISDIIKNGDNSELISVGSRGNGVEEVQQILLDQNKEYDLGEEGVDGKFGFFTKGAVNKFQVDNDLEPDGIVGIETSKALSGVS